MKKTLVLSSAISCYTLLPAQNVGIGTNIPATNLHVLSTSASIKTVRATLPPPAACSVLHLFGTEINF